ncbi:MAG: hypothetical protein SFX73_19780 [Kofleriaceae bacterium]|nr:hypothetical protein [Kofleriaceae bacterium]
MTSSVPPRRAVCPRCPRVGRAAQHCDLEGARLLDLEVEQDREEMLAAIWGAPEQRALLEQQLARPSPSPTDASRSRAPSAP